MTYCNCVKGCGSHKGVLVFGLARYALLIKVCIVVSAVKAKNSQY